MTYTFWHSGILIGESELDETSTNPGQRAGIFEPTQYGLEIFPRLSGILSIGRELKMHLEANSLDADEMSKDQIIDLLEDTPAGKKLIDLGRTLSEVEMRAPDGTPLTFSSIAFSDLLELRRLAPDVDPELLDDLPTEELAGPRYIVSATLGDSPSDDDVHVPPKVRARRWSEDN